MRKVVGILLGILAVSGGLLAWMMIGQYASTHDRTEEPQTITTINRVWPNTKSAPWEGNLLIEVGRDKPRLLVFNQDPTWGDEVVDGEHIPDADLTFSKNTWDFEGGWRFDLPEQLLDGVTEMFWNPKTGKFLVNRWHGNVNIKDRIGKEAVLVMYRSGIAGVPIRIDMSKKEDNEPKNP